MGNARRPMGRSIAPAGRWAHTARVRRHWTSLLLLGGLASAAWAIGAPSARAEAPILVVVEVRGGEADVPAIRERLAEALRAPVLSPFDAEGTPARGTLAIGMDYERGSARVQYRTSDATLVRITAPVPDGADAEGLWIVDDVVALVREAERRSDRSRLVQCPEVIDPWGHQGRARFDSSFFQLPSEVLDPFSGPEPYAERRADYRLPPEVLDPWDPAFRGATRRSRATDRRATGTEEGGRALSPPPPASDD